jgi:hypothetical protein
MAQTEVPAAAAEHHSARVTNQTQELVFPVKVAPVAAEISGQILLIIAEAAAAVVRAQRVEMQAVAAQLKPEV